MGGGRRQCPLYCIASIKRVASSLSVSFRAASSPAMPRMSGLTCHALPVCARTDRGRATAATRATTTTKLNIELNMSVLHLGFRQRLHRDVQTRRASSLVTDTRAARKSPHVR